MEPQAHARYEVVQCSVNGHAPYGLLIESEDGERGFVDSSYITDNPGEPWPVIGQQLRCVVLGYTRGGRLRVAATPRYVEMVAAAGDPAAANDQWSSRTGRTGSTS